KKKKKIHTEASRLFLLSFLYMNRKTIKVGRKKKKTNRRGQSVTLGGRRGVKTAAANLCVL
ncbi:MAG: hypothetical protein ACK5JU_13205, partial [Bacteroidales bacterium]